jgi:hypothetical protein
MQDIIKQQFAERSADLSFNASFGYIRSLFLRYTCIMQAPDAALVVTQKSPNPIIFMMPKRLNS